MRDRVFGKDRQAQAVNHLGDAVVDFRVKVVGAAAQNDSVDAKSDYALQGFLALLLNLGAEFFLLFPSRVNGPHHHVKRNLLEVRMQFLKQAVAQAALVVNRQEGVKVQY